MSLSGSYKYSKSLPFPSSKIPPFSSFFQLLPLLPHSTPFLLLTKPKFPQQFSPPSLSLFLYIYHQYFPSFSLSLSLLISLFLISQHTHTHSLKSHEICNSNSIGNGLHPLLSPLSSSLRPLSHSLSIH